MDLSSSSVSPRDLNRRRGRHAFVVAAVLAALVACGDPYLHLNPYDSERPVEFTFTGPDSLFSAGAVGQYTVQTNPSLPDTAFVWGIDSFTNYLLQVTPQMAMQCQTQFVYGGTVLSKDGPGVYQLVAPPLEPDAFRLVISASVGIIDTADVEPLCGMGFHLVFFKFPRHVGRKTVVVTQRLTSIRLRCPDTHACDPLAVGDSASVWVDGFDALGNGIAAFNAATNPATGHPVAMFVSRDSTVARITPVGIRVARVTARKAGSTWIVATRGTLMDSLEVAVH